MLDFKKVVKSPLRYAGGKRRLFNIIKGYIPHYSKEIVSPFMGGGALEINLAIRGVSIFGYDIDQPLMNFWKYWLKDPIKLQKSAESKLENYSIEELVKEKTYRFLNKNDVDIHSFEQSVFYYIFNKLDFGGQTLRSAYVNDFMKRGDIWYTSCKREGKTSYDRLFSSKVHLKPINNIYTDNARFEFVLDIDRYKDMLFYMDPPYFKHEGCYNIKRFDHRKLRDMIGGLKKWILSYGDCKYIRNLYDGYTMHSLDYRYMLNQGGREAAELIILSDEISEYANEQPSQLSLF